MRITSRTGGSEKRIHIPSVVNGASELWLRATGQPVTTEREHGSFERKNTYP